MYKHIIINLCLSVFIGTFSNISSTNEKSVGIFYDERFLLHDTGPNHTENPERLNSVIRDLRNNQSISSKIIWPKFKEATIDDLNLVHTKEYIELVDRQVSQLNNNRAFLSTGDTPISKDSNLVAKLAVGAGLEAVDQSWVLAPLTIIAGSYMSLHAETFEPANQATPSHKNNPNS